MPVKQSLLSRCENLPAAATFHKVMGLLSDRELAVLSLIAAGHGPGQIARELGVSRKTVECHCEHIKLKLGYPNAEALHRGARELLGTSDRSARNPR